MDHAISLNDITIRNNLKPGNIGYVTYLHGVLYSEEYNYGIEFETYVGAGLNEFYKNYKSARNRVWIAEHENRIVGFLLLMDRGDSAQLRYFLITRDYRGIGLGRKLMGLYMDFFKSSGYRSTYLWTTHELESAATIYKKFGFGLTKEIDSTAFGKALREQRYDLIL